MRTDAAEMIPKGYKMDKARIARGKIKEGPFIVEGLWDLLRKAVWNKQQAVYSGHPRFTRFSDP